MAEKHPKILVATPLPPALPMAAASVEVARKYGVSPLKQMREFTALRFGATKLGSNEYYAARLFRDDLSSAEKREFVGEKSNRELNDRLSPDDIARRNDFLRDKVLVSALLEKLGLRATRAQAVFSLERGFGALLTLRSADEVAEFLKSKAKYPIFAKPISGSKSVGSALLAKFDPETSIVTLGNGRTGNVYRLAEEIVRDYPRGFVFEAAVTQHKDVTKLIGKALGCLRVVTVMDEGAPRVLYALWKIPAPDAMSDNFWQKGSMLGEIDIADGSLKQVRRGSGLQSEVIEAHPVSGIAFEGYRIPNWDKVQELATAAHRISPENGVLGWDIGISKDGPVVVECNTNPFHSLYQQATGRGVLNADFKPVFEKITARNAKILAAIKASKKNK